MLEENRIAGDTEFEETSRIGAMAPDYSAVGEFSMKDKAVVSGQHGGRKRVLKKRNRSGRTADSRIIVV
jgi:hypothetical protein